MRVVVRSVVAALVGVGLVVGVAPPAVADAVRDSQWHAGFLKLSEVHRISQGEGVTVAVVDSGVDATHPDLQGSILPGTDVWSAKRDGLSDGDGHGTAMASLIAGHGHGVGGRDGILGVAPKAKILTVGVFRPGVERAADAAVAEGIRWAADHGAQVICTALGGGGGDAAIEAVYYALGKGIPIVAAAGNRPDAGAIEFPAFMRGVIAVSAIDQAGTFASSVSVSGDAMTVAAPGVSIPAAQPGGKYATGKGTSNSTAIVAGVVALLRQKYPTATREQLFERLKQTAVDKGPPGHDDDYGWGVVDPLAALTKDIKFDTSPSASPSRTRTSQSAFPQVEETSTLTRVVKTVVVLGGAVVVLGLVVFAIVWLSLRRRRARRQ